MNPALLQFRRLLVAGTLALGGSAAIIFLIMSAVDIYRGNFVHQRDYIMLSFHANGDPYLTRINWSQSYREYFDLDGNPITVMDEEGYTNPALLAPTYPRPFHRGAASWITRIIGFLEYGKPPNYWFLVTDGQTAGHGWFAGYSGANYRSIGFIGTAGFREEPIPLAEQFPIRGGEAWEGSQIACTGGTYNLARAPQGVSQTASGKHVFQPWVVFVNSGSTVYEVNLASRAVRSIVSDLEQPVISMDTGGHWQKNVGQNWIALRSADQVRFYAPDRTLKTLPLAEPLQGHFLELAERPDGTFTAVAQGADDYDQDVRHETIYLAAADGMLGDPHKTSVTLNNRGPSSVYEAALVDGSPAVLLYSLAVFRTRGLIDREMADSWSEAFPIALREYALYLSATIVIGAVLAFLAYRRQVLYQTSSAERVIWPGFVFLFGLPGWLGYRYGRFWPPLAPCPICHATAPQSGEACALCDRELPLPEVKGTEIFA